MEIKDLPVEAQELIKSLQARADKTDAESKQRKEQLRKLEAERKAEQEAATTALKEQGEYKRLYEESLEKIAALELQAQRADLYGNALSESVASRAQQLPEEYRDLLPAVDPAEQLKWLDAALPKLTRPVPERRDTQSSIERAVPLTAEQEAVRKAAKMTVEEYRAGLARAEG